MTEREVNEAKLFELQQNMITAIPLTEIHRFLFEGIYPHAGQLRTSTIWKGIMFYEHDDLGIKLMKHLHSMTNRIDMSVHTENFIKYLAEDYAYLNFLHPFYEGNGRTQREFLREVLMKYNLIFDLNKTSYSDMKQASIDGCRHRYAMFENIFKNCIEENKDPIGYYRSLPYIAILSHDD